MIQRVVDLNADVKLIITLRTEYYGRLLDHLRAGRRDFSLALASWCARRGRMHKTGGVFSGEIRGQC